MKQSTYNQLVSNLNFKRNLSITLLLLLCNAALFSFAYNLLSLAGILPYVTAQLLLAVVFLQAFVLLHECGHYAAAKSRLLNKIIGHVISPFCFMPFFPWVYIHNEHHKWTGHLEKDPVFALLKQGKEKGKFPKIIHVGWNSLLPINALLLHLVYWAYPLKVYKSKRMNLVMFRRCLFSVLWLFTCYITAYLTLPLLFSSVWNALPAILIYGILWELLSTPQHLGMPTTLHKPSLQDHANTTRSTRFPKLIGKYLFLNFGYHIEHHFFPTLPWHELEKAHLLLKTQLANDYTDVKGGIWNIKTRSKNIEKFLGLK